MSKATYTGDSIGDNLPACDLKNPADLEAWFGNFGHFDFYRKLVIANCREIVRATAAMGNQKLTEARIDDMAHVHPLYFDFLTKGLEGRRRREEMVREAIGGGYGR